MSGKEPLMRIVTWNVNSLNARAGDLNVAPRPEDVWSVEALA